MSCKPFKSADGSIVGITCSRTSIKEKISSCYKCGKPATLLCDAPKGDNAFGKSCDKPMCSECAHRIGNDNDVCDEHFNEINIKQAKENRVKLESLGWDRVKTYTCPICQNGEHSNNAKFCKICGTKIESEGRINV